MTTTARTTTDELIERARGLVPRLRADAGRIEQERRLPSALVDELRDAGFFHMQLPVEYGGLQLDPVGVARVVEELARGDASAAWCVMLASQSACFAGLFDAATAQEFWAGGGIMAGVARPIGRAEPSRDGYVVSGRWPFASGSSHADWFGGECLVYVDGEPRKSENGEPESVMMVFPRSDVTVIENWDTLGLRGTASNDFSVEGAFVPARRTARYSDAPQHEWRLYRNLTLFAAGHGSHAIGVARGAIEAALELVQAKRGWGNVPLRESARVQAGIAEATVLVDAAARHLYGTCGELWDRTAAGEDDATLRARVRLSLSHAASSALRAVDMLHALLATSAIFKTNPLERSFRDMHTAAAHVMIGPLTYEAAGRVLLGLEPNFPFF
jgi:alkylation response protein AidB-like acyl-CoA dehydrogenase